MREKDNFLALLLNESVSIATVQPATREGGKCGCTRDTSGKRGIQGEYDAVTIATLEEGERELGESLKKNIKR